MLDSISINKNITKLGQKVLLRDSDINKLSLLRKFSINAYLIFLRKADFFEAIRIEGVEVELVNSLRIDKNSMVYSLLKNSENTIKQQEVLSACKDSIVFHREGSQSFRKEIDYWEKLGLEFFYPVKDKVFGLIGFAVFSYPQKIKVTKNNTKNFLSFLEDDIRYTFEGEREKQVTQDVVLYKGLFNVLRDASKSSEEDSYEKIFLYFKELLGAKSSIMYILQEKYYVPIRYKNVTFIKPILRQDVEKLSNGEDNSGVFAEEIGSKTVMIVRPFKKMLLVYKEDSLKVQAELLEDVINIIGKFFK